MLLLALALITTACNVSDPADTHTQESAETDPNGTFASPETAEPDEGTAPSEDPPATDLPASDTDGADTPAADSGESEGAAESDTAPASDGTTAPADTSEDVTEPPDTTSAEPDTLPAEPEETGPGQLLHVSNDELLYMDNMGQQIGSAFGMGEYVSWSHTVTVGRDQVAVFMDLGWVAFNSSEYVFGYIVNGASYFSDSYAREAEENVVDYAKKIGAIGCARFVGGLTVEALQLGANQVQFCVMLDGDVLCVLREYTVNLTQNPVRLDGTFWLVDMDTWEVSGHKKGITSATDPSHGGMVKAGGVDRGALLHQGAIGIGTLDLSKYSKIVVYYGCDASAVTQGHYNASANNRIMISRVDTDGMNAPDQKDIIASATYPLLGWSPNALEIDLTGINYKGPVYITVDALPGTFMLITAIELIGGEKPEGGDTPSTPTPPPTEENYTPSMQNWEVTGHKKGITSASDPTHGGMVAAGGVSEGALLHQGAIGVGEVDLSKYSKVIVYYGCDASSVTRNHYNNSPNNRIMLAKVDTDGKNAPEQSDLIAYETYDLRGWTPYGLEIDLTGIKYEGPVYISVDTLPGTFMLITAIEFVV